MEIATTVDATNAERKSQNLPALDAAARAKIASEIAGWLIPSYTAMRYGHPAYCQLHRACPAQIATGAEDGSEMGAFSFLKSAQRVANLRAALEEYLRLGLEAGIMYAT